MKQSVWSRFKAWVRTKVGVAIAPAQKPTGHCDCKLPIKAEYLGYVEHAYLRSGHHTAFAIMRCRRCKRITGFPDDNLTNAVENGTPGTKAYLMKLMNQPVPLDVAYAATLGGVMAISPERYRRALDEIAELLGRENDETFRAEVRAHELTLPCDID